VRRRLVAALAAALPVVAAASPVSAATIRVAVAANFQPALQALAGPFRASSGHELLMSAGSSGKLAAQVEQGAPFDVFLSADDERPRHLVERGLAVGASRFTYARGRLVLWSAREGWTLGPEVLRGGDFHHLAIASPEAAPYGAAALEVLDRLGALRRVEPRLVRGESIGQTFAFVASGAAEIGFVALSQLEGPPRPAAGSRWLVPAELHAPIEQQAVLLTAAAEPAAARAFLAFLSGPEALRVLTAFGYEPPP
jgi:molybdate transport system substrate-binding protein